jgi:hypothetical protein
VPRAEPFGAPPTAQPELDVAEVLSAVGGVPPPFAPVVPPAPPPVPVVWGVPFASLGALPNVPSGDAHILTGSDVGGVVVPEGLGSPGAIAAPVPASVAAGADTVRVGSPSTHVQAAGQSVFAVQLVAFGVQEPGKVVIVVQVLPGGTGALPLVFGPAWPDPVEAMPVEAVPAVIVPASALPPPPEQAPVTDGAQVNPSPQSVSTLHGSCHLYAHVETLFVVHELGVGGRGSHSVLGAHPTAVPPVHS